MLLDILSQTYYGIPLEKIIISLGIIVGSFILGKIVYKLFKSIGRKLTSKTSSDLDDVLIDIIEEPIVAGIFLAGAYYSFNFLGVQNTGINGFFFVAFKIAVILVLAWTGIRVIDAIAKKILVPLSQKTSSSFDDHLIPLFSKGFKAIIGVTALIMALDSVGFDITAILAGLGIGGLAIAFAAQETIANFFGGISLILDKSFSVGDKIRLDSGELGVVVEVGLRSTRIRTYSNEVIIIPNSIMAKSKIINYAQPDSYGRGSINFGVAYGSDAGKVQKLIKEVIDKNPKVSKSKDKETVVEFMSMGDFSLNFTAKFWCDEYNDVYPTERELTKEIYDALNKNKIEIPFPTHTVYMKNNR